MKRLIFFLSFLSAGVFSHAQRSDVPYVVLVSIDGFRHDYVKNFNPPHLSSFISKGSKTEALIPSFPSKTFPNHYSIVTGLNPGNHGLVDNTFYDRHRQVIYKMSKKKLVTDPYFYGGVPLWELARRNKIKSASFFWPGSEMTEDARRPDYTIPFDDDFDNNLRVDGVIDWLKLPAADRPHFITLYFSIVDHAGHDFGPSSEQTKQAVLKVDSLLGKLMKGIESTQLPVNMILVSDHGMYELTKREHTYIFIDELINRSDTTIKLANGGTQTHLYFKSKKTRDSLYAKLKKQENNFTVLKKEDSPKRWNYNHDRVGDIIIEAKLGYYIREGSRERFLKSLKAGDKFGVHGYDPELTPDVRGIFYAQGPNINSGITLPPFQNIHVYPLIAEILGLPLPKIDGSRDVLIKLYKSN
jgi:predicted AlkP superfamily pyrophosphatase or phosphodiesterase